MKNQPTSNIKTERLPVNILVSISLHFYALVLTLIFSLITSSFSLRVNVLESLNFRFVTSFNDVVFQSQALSTFLA